MPLVSTGGSYLNILYISNMALFGIVVQLDKKTKKLLKDINCKLDKLLSNNNDEKIKQEIMDKLNNAISDIKSTIKN